MPRRLALLVAVAAALPLLVWAQQRTITLTPSNVQLQDVRYQRLADGGFVVTSCGRLVDPASGEALQLRCFEALPGTATQVKLFGACGRVGEALLIRNFGLGDAGYSTALPLP